MKSKPLPPLEELKEYLDYNPDTGIFIWKKSNNGFIKEGRKAGSLNSNGYNRIQFMKNEVMLHRVAYYMHYGVDPLEKLVDHINGDKADNRIKNLRLVTNQQNLFNKSSLSKRNFSGFTGVFWSKKARKWQVSIVYNGKNIYLGLYSNKEDAIKARKEAEIKYYGEFRRQESEKEKSICWLGVIPEGMKDEMRYPTEEEIDKFLEEAENDEQTTN
jgi:hypothetical protein